MVRDFAAGLAVLILSAVIAGGVHFRRVHPHGVSNQASVKVKKPVHPIVKLARAVHDKSPEQAGINCFGTTMAAFGESAIPRYASDAELGLFLESSCRELDPKEPSATFDVGVIYGSERMDLTHSFIFFGRRLAFYKNGVEAKTKFLLGPILPMMRDFRVGLSREKCDELAANATEESGLPCPALVRRYRCKSGLMPRWPAIERVELLIYSHAMKSASINDEAKADIVDALNELKSVASIETVRSTHGIERRKLVTRLESLETFFGFYADRQIWGEDFRRDIRHLLRGVVVDVKRE